MIKISLEKIQAKIIENGENEIKRINKEAKRKIDEIKEDIKRKINGYADEIKKEREPEIELIRRRIIAEANVKVKELIGQERNKILDRAFEEAGNRILKLDNEQKRHILENLAKEGKESVSDPIILVDEKYRDLLNGAEPSKIDDFGVIVMSRDKKLRIDNTLRNRLQQLKAIIKPEVASILFRQ